MIRILPGVGARVVVEDVTRTYDGSVTALAGVSFELAAGTFTALVGPSGCGKSTLLNLLGALDTASSGRVVVDGRDLARLGESDRDEYRLRRAGTVFQFFNLLPTMTAVENVALPLLLAGVPSGAADERAAAALISVGLAGKERAYPYQLSGGQMQRVAVARAVINGPALLLADEPTGNLDSKAGAQVLELIASLVRERGLTAVMATHSEKAAAYATRELHLLDGRLAP